jgi:hypothetical protein
VGRFGKIATPSQVEEFNAAFAREAMILAAIKHESLVSVRDHFSEVDRPYLVLESVPGENLEKLLEPGADRPALSEILLWADQLLGVLEYLHSLSPPVFHSNIKPGNLKLSADRKIKLLPVQAARRSQPNGQVTNQTTEDPAFCYKPLEQLWPDLGQVSQRVILNHYDEPAADVLLRPLDARSDLYSVASSFYHVLTGVAPCDALERTIAVLDNRPDPLTKAADLDPKIPVEISDALTIAMALRRENRFDSAVIMRQVLRTAVVRAQERITSASAKPALSESPDDHLDVERTKAEEREREIRAEQERLDQEQRKIEARRLELEGERQRQAAELERLRVEAEAEQKRREAELQERERQRVALRLAELEAQREQERAEEERLAQEAEAEKRRAEERLQELKLKQEQHRAEQKRIEEEARKEIELAEERIKELSFSDLKIDDIFDDDDLAVPQFGEQPGFNWRMPAMIGGLAIVLAGGVGGWIFMSADLNAPSSVTQRSVMSSLEQPRQQVTDTPAATQDAPAASDLPQTPPADPGASEAVTSDGTQSLSERQKRPQTAAIQEKPKKPAAEKPTPPAKKKVTVDDLINDN